MICKSLSIINLSNNKIGDRGAAALSYLLGSDSLLSKLHLNNNRIGDKGAKALAEKIKGNRMLHTLSLGYNLIGIEGGVALAKGLERVSLFAPSEVTENLDVILFLLINTIFDDGIKN